MNKFAIAFGIAVLALFAACSSSGSTDTGKVIKSTAVGNNLTVTLSNKDGVLKNGDNEFFVSFKDGSGKTVDVGAVGLNFYMPTMGTMSAMNKATTFTTTSTPGVYQGKATLESAGEWQAQVSYEGSAVKGKATFPVIAQ
jgi:hypothetical protein